MITPQYLILEVVSILVYIIHNQIIYYLLSIPSVHEDTTAVHYDIENADINDVTLTTPTEKENEVVFETHQNGKSIILFHYDNWIISSIHSQMMNAPVSVQMMRL